MAIVLVVKREGPWATMKDISWSVLPLVAGLFVLVEALKTTGVLATIGDQLKALAQHSDLEAGWISGIAIAIACNLVNNLPAGLLAGAAVHAAHVSDEVAGAILVGVDVGPNLSVTGSLATVAHRDPARGRGRQRVDDHEARAVGHAGGACRDARRVAVLIVTPTPETQMILIYPFIIVAGALQAIGNAMNAQLRGRLVNPWLAATVSFLPIVFVFVTLFFVMPMPLPTLETLSKMPWFAPLGGAAGAVAVFGGLAFVDKVGAGPFNGLALTTNILTSLALDAFGLFRADRIRVQAHVVAGRPPDGSRRGIHRRHRWQERR